MHGYFVQLLYLRVEEWCLIEEMWLSLVTCKYTDGVSLNTSFASIFASNLAFLMRLTIHRSASSALRLSLVANMLRDKEWTEKEEKAIE